MQVRADISASLAATLTGELRLDVQQTKAVRPSVAADRGPMTAAIIGAIDQETANACAAHFSEGDSSGGRGRACPPKTVFQISFCSIGFGWFLFSKFLKLFNLINNGRAFSGPSLFLCRLAADGDPVLAQHGQAAYLGAIGRVSRPL
jgi:hypothetical protein